MPRIWVEIRRQSRFWLESGPAAVETAENVTRIAARHGRQDSGASVLSGSGRGAGALRFEHMLGEDLRGVAPESRHLSGPIVGELRLDLAIAELFDIDQIRRRAEQRPELALAVVLI
ncbi:hypothetical protein LMG29542_02338 [Paraburkholderia humisilvae]|uniref:Uncharacterized protein n=1 Tax=Paraburkholderia humisilvae TaxID=627669 RepID=A0A6J5DMH2_9BURK|nr:hypothetical protein LMG29542_02338 [Paraburkholderia humisilvae]